MGSSIEIGNGEWIYYGKWIRRRMRSGWSKGREFKGGGGKEGMRREGKDYGKLLVCVEYL